MASHDSPPSMTITDHARQYSKDIINPVATFLYKRNIHPDWITWSGLVIVIVASLFITQGEFLIAGIILVFGLPLDALDGAVARLRDDIAERPFGGYLDSTLDRYADAFIFGAIALYGDLNNQSTIAYVAIVALAGAFFVSYTRARAEAMNVECKIGLFTRLERTIAIFILLFTGWILPMLYVLAIGTHFTALQRIFHVRNSTN